MPRFAKQPHCPASATLQAYGAGTLSFLARPGVAAHLAACDFCGAELSLLLVHGTRPVKPMEVEPTMTTTPAMPLALRLLAQSALAEVAAGVRAGERRAA